jgi:hypothetical protein
MRTTTLNKQNPFDKSRFACHRDWEESLITFLAREARAPDTRRWLEFANAEPNVRASAAFSALLLSDLLEVRPDFREEADTTYQLYNALKVADNETEAFEHWLRSGWLNVARIADLLEFELTR